MRPGRVPTVDGRPIEPVRHPWHRRFPPRRGPAEIGLFAFLTILAWGVWIYLVLPLAVLVLWWLGVERVFEEVFTVGYEDLSQTLLSYTGVFLVMISLFGLWVLWNVVCYGGTVGPDDRAPRVAGRRARRAAGVARGELAALRNARVVRVDLDEEDRVLVLGGAPARPPASSRRINPRRARRSPPPG